MLGVPPLPFRVPPFLELDVNLNQLDTTFA